METMGVWCGILVHIEGGGYATTEEELMTASQKEAESKCTHTALNKYI